MRHGLYILILLVAVGCAAQRELESSSQPIRVAPSSNTSPTYPARMELDPAQAIASFESHIRRDGSVLFRSWNGVLQGSDCDTDLQFLKDGRVQMTEYGLAVEKYTGSYTIDATGQITAVFPKFGQTWPPMRLRRDDRSLILVPPPSTAGSGTTMPASGGTYMSVAAGYWPFRLVATRASP
jgi:hypothetical protein